MSRIDSAWTGRVIFLVGARRSGTNWLHRIVDAHPDVGVIPSETYLFSGGIQPLADRFQHGLAGSAQTGFVYMDRNRFLDATRAFCDEVLDGLARVIPVPPGGRIGERTPDHVRHLDLIGSVYPDAWVVHIVRDGRDVARSLVSQDWGPQTLADAAEEWRSAVAAGRRSGERLERYREIRYEHLLHDAPAEVERLFDWLELEVRPATIDKALQQSAVPYNVDPALPTVGEGKWRSTFTPEDLAAVEGIAGPLLDELGYDREGTSGVRSASDGIAQSRPGVRERLRRRRQSRPVERLVNRRLDQSQVVIDALMADVAAQRFDELGRHFAEAAKVRWSGRDDAWTDTGPSAVQRLAEQLRHDEVLRGPQLRADVYPGVPSFTIAALYESPDGTTHPRVIVAAVVGGLISELGYVAF